MDRDELSAAIIQEMGAVFMNAVAAVLPRLLQRDRAEMERQGQQLSRAVLGRLVECVVAAQEAARPVVACPACGGRLWREHRARVRHRQGLLGDYRLVRATYRCAACGAGAIPCDAHLGLGPGVLSPGLARVVGRESLVQPFEQAVEGVAEALGVQVTAEVARRTTEALGAVAEAEVQAAMARVVQGQDAWPAEAPVQDPPASGVLAVEVDGLFVPCDDGWHELKGVTVAPLGPAVESDADTHAAGRGARQLRRRTAGGPGLLGPRLRRSVPAWAGHAGRADRGCDRGCRRLDLARRAGFPGATGRGGGGEHRPLSCL